MHKTHMVSGLLLIAAAGLLTGAQPLDPASAARAAMANGTFTIEGDGDHDEGIGFINFTIEERRGGRPRGTMVFGSEHHHGVAYPDLTAKMDEIRSAAFTSSTVEFEGRGVLLLEPVFIKAQAYDGDADSEPDWFSIWITDDDGALLFEARGPLYIGDISIGD